tara:strand:+ start:1788 stop:2102 length:315 start_codon:yes stop_codon:yes gene_type:complete
MTTLTNMTFEDYKSTIEKWVNTCNEAGLTYTNGKPVSRALFKTVLGVKRSAHTQMLNGTYKRNPQCPIPMPVQQAIRFAEKLPTRSFISMVKLHIPEFEASRNN